MKKIVDIRDMQTAAKRRVPTMFYDYADSGSWSEATYVENTDAFKKHWLRQRVACNIKQRSLKTQMIGQDVAMPVALAPVGLSGMQFPDGEIHAALAAEKVGIPFTLSTMSICSIEAVASATTHPFWFQLYVMRDRGFVENLIARAQAAGCSAIVLTLDLQIMAQRHKDIKNGLTAPPKLNLNSIIDFMRHPSWALGMMGTKNRTLGNIVGHAPGVEDMTSLSEWTAEQYDPEIDWGILDWVKSKWNGKLILKGINDVEDAKIAAASGADAIVVSNHGGRQLDGAVATIDMLPHIVDAVGDKIEVHLDSGIRSGQDIFKALSLGATSTYVGRAYIYGLAAAGGAGVVKALEILKKELDLTMAFCGETSVTEIGSHNLAHLDDLSKYPKT